MCGGGCSGVFVCVCDCVCVGWGAWMYASAFVWLRMHVYRCLSVCMCMGACAYACV